MNFINTISHYLFRGAGTRTIRDTKASKALAGTGTVSRFAVVVGFFFSCLFIYSPEDNQIQWHDYEPWQGLSICQPNPHRHIEFVHRNYKQRSRGFHPYPENYQPELTASGVAYNEVHWSCLPTPHCTSMQILRRLQSRMFSFVSDQPSNDSQIETRQRSALEIIQERWIYLLLAILTVMFLGYSTRWYEDEKRRERELLRFRQDPQETTTTQSNRHYSRAIGLLLGGLILLTATWIYLFVT
jgi:hypothetical protein